MKGDEDKTENDIKGAEDRVEEEEKWEKSWRTTVET